MVYTVLDINVATVCATSPHLMPPFVGSTELNSVFIHWENRRTTTPGVVDKEDEVSKCRQSCSAGRLADHMTLTQ